MYTETFGKFTNCGAASDSKKFRRNFGTRSVSSGVSWRCAQTYEVGSEPKVPLAQRHDSNVYSINQKNKNKKWKPRHLKEEDVNKYEKPCQVVLLRKLTKERRSIPSTIYGFPQG